MSDEQNEATILHGDYSASSLEDSSAKLQSVVKGASFRIMVCRLKIMSDPWLFFLLQIIYHYFFCRVGV